jgi:hypothetical protein
VGPARAPRHPSAGAGCRGLNTPRRPGRRVPSGSAGSGERPGMRYRLFSNHGGRGSLPWENRRAARARTPRSTHSRGRKRSGAGRALRGDAWRTTRPTGAYDPGAPRG